MDKRAFWLEPPLKLSAVDDVTPKMRALGLGAAAKVAALGIDVGAKVAAVGTDLKQQFAPLPRIHYPSHAELLASALFGDPEDDEEDLCLE